MNFLMANCPPSPSGQTGHIYFFGSGVTTPGELAGEYDGRSEFSLRQTT